MAKEFLKTKQIKIGSIWKAADGGDYGHKVTGHLKNGDVSVRPIVKGKLKGPATTIDSFKLQYRYAPAEKKAVRVPDHRPGKVESLNSYVAAGGTRAQRMAKRITTLLDKDPARKAQIEAQERDTSRISGSAKLDRERAFEEKERAIQEHYANEQLREAIKRGASFSDGEDDYTQEARDSVAAHLRKERAARQANNAKIAAQMGQKVPAGYDTLTGDKHLSEQGVKNALAYRRSKPLTFEEQSKIHPNMPLATASQQRDEVRGTRMDYGGGGGKGKGRGNWGHRGRPGKRGGSA